MMKKMIMELKDIGVTDIFLQTSKDSYVERWYEKLGFSRIFIGICFSKE